MMPPSDYRYLVDYMVEAITLEWQDDVFIKFTLRKLTQEEMDEISFKNKLLLE